MSSISAPACKAVDVTRLPTLPQILFRLLDACESDDTNLSDIADLILCDSALASRVLALSSSPVYAGHGNAQRHSLEQALLMLGLNTARTLALTAAVHEHLNQSLGARSALLRHFWRDALLTGLLAERLARLSGYAAEHEAYLGGLISNIGQIGLLVHDAASYESILNNTTGDAENLARQEIKTFGRTHAEVGTLMLQQAGRKGPLVDAVRFHHADADELVDAHHLVRLVATANGLLSNRDEPNAVGLVAADRMLGLLPSLVEHIYAEAASQARQICAEFGIDLNEQSPTTPAPPEDPLARRLGELNIISGVRRQLADTDDLEALLGAAHLACSLIFGVQELGFFLLDDTKEKAVGHAVSVTAPIWKELALQLPAPQSLVGAVFADARPRCHYHWNRAHPDSARPSVLDYEITALLDRQGLLALPLKAGGNVVGVLAIGVNEADEDRLDERRQLLMLFARELGTAIAALNTRKRRDDAELEAQAAEFHLRARSVVHEANNPLSIINNYLAILGHHTDAAPEKVPDDLRILGEEITRVGAIVRSLVDATETPERDDRTDINTLIRNVANLLRPTLIAPAELNLELSLDPRIPTLATSRNSLKQILVNLLKNAAEALIAGQTITVRTEDALHLGSALYVSITVADNGPGLPDHVLDALFQPVDSTKGKGHSGLGLSISKRLVDELQGKITCQSSREHGTRFQILLPRRLPEEERT